MPHHRHLLVLLAACATTPPPQRPIETGSRGMRASEHLEAARDHDRQAREDTMWPDTRPVDSGTGRVDQPIAFPWRQSDDTTHHTQLAASHRAAAAEQQAQFQRACESFSTDDIERSPIAHYGVGGLPTAHGVIVFLAGEAGPAPHLLAEIACHRAWLMLDSHIAMENCALDLDGVRFDAIGSEGGVTLQITSTDPAIVQELQRRVAHDLEKH